MENFSKLTIKECFAKLKTGKKGLSIKEAKKRTAKYGLNKIEVEKSASKLKIFISQFNNPLIWVLLAAGVVSIAFDEHVDAGVIFVTVLLNTLIGFFQENKANNALEKLKKVIEHKALVFRDGQEIEIDSSLLVVGDLVVLQAGSRVSADARIIEAHDLSIIEASLTGESIPSEKSTEKLLGNEPLADRENMAYAGTVIAGGSGLAIVTAVGINTEIGQIADLVKNNKEEETPLQARLKKLASFIGVVVFILSSGVILIGVWQGREFLEMFITGVAIAVASVPSELAIAVTVVLVLGMQRILKENALTRRLIAAETLGSTTVICADKTGTLTEGKMVLDQVAVGSKEFNFKELSGDFSKSKFDQPRLVVKIGALCNNAVIENPKDALEKWRIIGTPTESALIVASKRAGLNRSSLLNKEPRIDELPFDSAYKYMITLHKSRGKHMLYEKGAPEKIINKAQFFLQDGEVLKIDKKSREKLFSVAEKLTEKGLRVIGTAYREIENLKWEGEDRDWKKIDKDLIFAGFLAMEDPLRPEAKETIRLCQRAGIRPVIITGDHKLTAKAIAKEIGLRISDKNIMTGDVLDQISEQKLKKIVDKIDVYARVSPHHKLRIIKAWQARGEVVAMTGDGVNDSPALKAADIGISLGTGTDIAKDSSDLVLLDNDFKTIVSAVKQGRVIFANIRKVVTYLVSDGFSIVILIIGSILLGMPLAILPTQILWINIINDALPSFSLAFEKESDNILDDKPIRRNEPIINREMKLIIFGAGIIRDFFIFAIFIFLFKNNFETDYIRTVVFAAVGVNSLIYIFSLRSLSQSIWRTNPFQNLHLVGAVLISFFLLLLAIYLPFLQKVLSTAPLDAGIWVLIFLSGFLMIVMIEVIKKFFISQSQK